jgi:hypothetical protein
VLDIDDLLLSVPPQEKFLEVVIEHFSHEEGDCREKDEIFEDERSHQRNWQPFVRRHLLAHPPSVPQMHVDYVLVLLLEVVIAQQEMLKKGLVVYADIGSSRLFEQFSHGFGLVSHNFLCQLFVHN